MILITYFEVNTALQLSHIYPAISSIILEKKEQVAYCQILQLNVNIQKVNLQSLIEKSLWCAELSWNREIPYLVLLKDFVVQPWQIVDSDFVFLARDCDQDVLSL